MNEEVNETAEVEEEVEETTTEEQVEEQTQEEPKQEEDDRHNGYLKRINKITWQREEATRQLEAERRERERLQAELEKVKQPQKKAPDAKPRIDDFDTDAEFLDALTDWKIEQRDRQTKSEQKKLRELDERRKADETYRETCMRVNGAGINKYEDYEQVVFSLPGNIMNKQLAEAVFETDRPEDVAYYLGKNRAEAERISRLNPRKQAIALGKLESQLEKPKKKTTKAPPPINPLAGAKKSEVNPDDLSPAEWIRLRNEGKI